MKLSFTTLIAVLAFGFTAVANPIALPFAQYLGLEPRALPTCSKESGKFLITVVFLIMA